MKQYMPFMTASKQFNEPVSLDTIHTQPYNSMKQTGSQNNDEVVSPHFGEEDNGIEKRLGLIKEQTSLSHKSMP